MPTSQLGSARKRRSTRIDEAIFLTVRGMDALRAPYVETVLTLTLSCHGCRYRSQHEPNLGGSVFLEARESDQGPLPIHAPARVRWLKPITTGKKEGVWDVGVELETPGNVWGVASPPKDWLLTRDPKVLGPAKSGQERRVAPRSEQQLAPVLDRVAAQLSVLDSTQPSLAPFLADLSEQVEKLISEAATALVVTEKDSLIGQFRAQLQEEMTRTLDRVIENCKEELVHKTLRQLTKQLEASARSTQEHWVAKVEEGLNSVSQRITAQAAQVSERIEEMAKTAIERLQLKMDTSRREMINELKIESLRLCQQTENFCQQLPQKCVDQVQQEISELKNQFESQVNERLARAGSELDDESAALIDKSKSALAKLSEGCQETAQGQLQALAVSAIAQLANTLNERATEISQQRLSELQNCASHYLESVSRSIAEVSKKTVPRHHD